MSDKRPEDDPDLIAGMKRLRILREQETTIEDILLAD